MRIGVNLMIWTDRFTAAHFGLLPKIRAMGYGGVEIPLLSPEAFAAKEAKKALDLEGLACTTSTALPPGASLVHPEGLERGVDWLRRCVEATVALGGSVCCGPLYAPVGHFTGTPRTRPEWEMCVEGLRRIAPEAEAAGVVLAIEPLNRFETYFLNTAADGAALVEAVGSPAVRLLLDTFHMNIEERSIPEALVSARAAVGHVHCSENDRGPVGSGHVPWTAVMESLKSSKYDGWLVVESFSSHLPGLARAASVWRPLAPSPEALAESSIRFLSGLLS